MSPSGIGIVGGTGPEGFGLAVRWCLAGKEVAIGSRSADRAHETARKIRDTIEPATIWAGTNNEVAQRCEVVIIALPLSALEVSLPPLASGLSGKLVVSVVAALDWVDGRPHPIQLAEGSAAQKVGRLLPGAVVTSGFQTLSAEKLGNPAEAMDEDCLICGDDRDARRTTMDLASAIPGVRALSAGRLENSYYPELLVGLLATLNRIHKAHSGFRVVGVGQ